MNILYVTQYFYPEVGATQNRALEMASHLVGSGYRVTVLTEFPNHPLGIIPERYRFKLFERETYRGIEIIRSFVNASPNKSFINRILFYLSFMISSIIAGMKLKDRKYDVVYATSPPLFVGLSGYIISRLKGSRFVFEVRDIWPDAAIALGELKNKFTIKAARWIERICYRKCEKVVVVTKGYCQNLLDKNVQSRKIKVIYNGANIEMFKPENSWKKLKEKHGYNGKFIVLHAGNFGLVHGMHSLVEVARLLAHESSIVFLLIGEGPMKNEVKHLTEKYQLTNLKIMDSVPTERIVEFFSMADVCLVTVKKNTLSKIVMPVKMFDSWACGRPIILTVDGEAKEHLSKANAGIYVDPEDHVGIRKAIIHLFNNPDLCQKYGRNGRRYVEKHFSRKVLAQELEKCLLTVLNNC